MGVSLELFCQDFGLASTFLWLTCGFLTRSHDELLHAPVPAVQMPAGILVPTSPGRSPTPQPVLVSRLLPDV